jgi:hypothetical protein
MASDIIGHPIGDRADDLYDTDFVLWAEHNAALLRSGASAEADLAHIAEEIDDLGKNWHRALESRLMQILLHLLKLRYQPEYPGVRGWRASVLVQRIEIERLLKKAPSLRPEIGGVLDGAYADAVYLASEETALPLTSFPASCPWSADEALDRNFFPGGE